MRIENIPPSSEEAALKLANKINSKLNRSSFIVKRRNKYTARMKGKEFLYSELSEYPIQFREIGGQIWRLGRKKSVLNALYGSATDDEARRKKKSRHQATGPIRIGTRRNSKPCKLYENATAATSRCCARRTKERKGLTKRCWWKVALDVMRKDC